MKVKITILFLLLLNFHLASLQAAEQTTSYRAPHIVDNSPLSIESDDDQPPSLVEELQILRREIEKVQQATNKLSEKFDKANSDIEYRLTQLESKTSIVAKAAQPDISASTKNKPATENSLVVSDKIKTTKELNKTSSKDEVRQQYETAIALVEEAKKAIKNTSPDTNSPAFKAAKEAVKAFIRNNPKSDLVGSSHYWLGELYMKYQVYNEAAISYLNGYKIFPNGPMAASSLAGLAQALTSMGKMSEACTTIAKLETDFKKPDARVQRAIEKVKKLAHCS